MSFKVHPLPTHLIVKENNFHHVHQTMAQYISNGYKTDESIASYNILTKMIVSSKSLYTDRHFLAPQRVKQAFYNFVLTLARSVEDYDKTTSYIKQVFDNIRKKRVTIHMILRGHGVKKIVIHPWRSVIETEDCAKDYVTNSEQQHRKFEQVFMSFFENINLNNIISLRVTTNMKTFSDAVMNHPLC